MVAKYTKPTPEALASLDRAMALAPLGSGERVLQGAAWLADKAVVEEVDGYNRGPWIDMMVRDLGMNPAGRYSWCAISMLWLALRAKAWAGGSPLVADWVKAARKAGRLRTKIARNLLCYRLHRNAKGELTGTGHIGIAKGLALGFVKSIEGNTSPGDAGSQSDGDGFYRKTRRVSYWDGYIEISQEKV